MKKSFSIILCIVMLTSVCLSMFTANAQSAAYSCTFEEESEMKPSLFGNAKIVFDESKGSNVLYLDGSDGTYARLPDSLLNGKDSVTVSFDIKSGTNSGNFFTFAIGSDSTKYSFLRLRGNEIRNAITTGSYQNEREAKGVLPYNNDWLNVALVFNEGEMKLYVNGKLSAQNADTKIKLSDLGSDLKIYFGKSFYSGDGYYKGYFDNIKIYEAALGEEEIKSDVTLKLPLLYSAVLGSVLDSPSSSIGTDSHTAVYTNIDRNKNEINSYVKPAQDLKAVPLSLNLRDSNTEVYINSVKVSEPYTLDLTSSKTLTLKSKDESITLNIKTPKLAKNPVLNGQYADPDIDILDGRFWIFPTTDGVAGWAGTQFHAFSSCDLVNWVDEGVILDVQSESEKVNSEGVKIATSKWSDINAWAPAIEGKNGKYYFYYCSNIKSEYASLYGNGMAIGVAVASSPNGPYVAADSPILYPKMLAESNIGFSGQVIDPSIFTDTNGSSYILFGNGMAAIAKLSDDMTSVDAESLELIRGLNDFRESIAVFKRNNRYYYTWSCDDTGSENYHINYGYTYNLGDEVNNKGTILEKDSDNGILATGHQSVLYIPESDKCFIAYHRFYTPLGQFDDGLDFHRETCIDEVTFTKKLLVDEINKVTPSYEGTGAYNTGGERISEIAPSHYGKKDDTPSVEPAPSAPAAKPVTVKVTVKKATLKSVKAGKKYFKASWKKLSGVTGYQLQYSTSKKFTKKTTKTKSLKKTTLTVKKLKSKKKYYIRVRAYKTVKQNGKSKTYYGNWSSLKSTKTK